MGYEIGRRVRGRKSLLQPAAVGWLGPFGRRCIRTLLRHQRGKVSWSSRWLYSTSSLLAPFLSLGDIWRGSGKLWAFASPWGQRLTTSVDMTKTRCLERTNLVEGKGLLTEGICWWVRLRSFGPWLAFQEGSCTETHLEVAWHRKNLDSWNCHFREVWKTITWKAYDKNQNFEIAGRSVTLRSQEQIDQDQAEKDAEDNRESEP